MTEEKILIMGKSVLSPVSKILELSRENETDYYNDVQQCLEGLEYSLESSKRILVLIYLAVRPLIDITIYEEWEDIYNRFTEEDMTKDDFIDKILDYEPNNLYQYLSIGLTRLFDDEFLRNKNDEIKLATQIG